MLKGCGIISKLKHYTMTEKEKNNHLLNPSELKKEIISPSNIDYLAGKAKEHNIGIKIERKYSNGASESLSI